MIAVLTLPERRTARVIVGIGLLFAIAYGSSLVLRPKPDGRVIVGDALHHYVQLRSAVFDRDLHFRNEYVRLYRLQGDERWAWVYEDTATGHVRNLMPVGPAIVWLPLFVLAITGVWVANLAGAAYPVDGYARLFQASAGFSGIAAAALGVWLSWRTCRRLFDTRAAAWAPLVLWLSSSAVYYSVISPTYSHATSLLATSAFWYAWVTTAGTLRRSVVLGVLVGCSALMRWQDAILLVPVVIDLAAAVAARRTSLGRALVSGGAALVAAGVAFVPQMIVWNTLYGQPLALPQGPDFMRWGEPALVNVLFSDWHGLFTWTPVVAIAVIGFVPLWQKDRRTAAAAAAMLLLSWYVNAAVADWWAGEAFGSRRFVSCFPVFAISLAALIEKWAPSVRQLAVAGGAVVAHTFLLLLQYQTFMHGLQDVAPYPRGAYNLWLARFVVPFDLAREWLLR